MTLYAIIHNLATGDRASTYDGMEKYQIIAMLSGANETATFVDQATYMAFLESHKPIPLDQATVTARLREDALSFLQINPGGQFKLQRAILLTILDQINTLRTNAGLSAVTVQQAIQAVINKINSGNAD